MELTITDIRHIEELGDIFYGRKMKIREYTAVYYELEFDNGRVINNFTKLDGLKSEQEVEKWLLNKYNIMKKEKSFNNDEDMGTEFVSLVKEKSETKTIFTDHIDSHDWSPTGDEPDEFDKVVYLGHCDIDGDMFACYVDNNIQIYKGVAGDEFK